MSKNQAQTKNIVKIDMEKLTTSIEKYYSNEEFERVLNLYKK